MRSQETDPIVAGVNAVAKVIADGNMYIDQIFAGSTVVPTVIIIACDDTDARHILTVHSTMPDVIARLPIALEANGWAWM